MKRTMLSIAMAGTLAISSGSVLAGQEWEESSKDAWIDGKAETVLLMNGNLNSFNIDTDVEDGVVVLSGDVETEVDKALAEELVVSLDGVKGVKNNINISEASADAKENDQERSQFLATLRDAKIATVVKTRLLLESEVSGTDINVDVERGKVILNGKVQSDAEKDLAVQIAKNTNDTRDVVDQLQVK